MQCLVATINQETLVLSLSADEHTFCIQYLNGESKPIVRPDVTDDDINVFSLQRCDVVRLWYHCRHLSLFVIVAPNL